MAIRWWFAFGLSAALLAGRPPLSAKPPELPLDPRVNCEVPPASVQEFNQEATTAPAPEKLAPPVSDRRKPTPAAEEASEPDAPELMSVPWEVEELPALPSEYLAGVMPAEVEELTAVPGELEQLRVMPAEAGENPAADGVSCPYLKMKMLRPTAPPAPVADCTPLDNLRKLRQARRLLEQAEYYARTGHPAAADALYRRVKALCPGSRYDDLASERMEKMHAGTSTGTGQAESEEPAADKPQSRAVPMPPVGCAERVEDLLQQCHQALRAGDRVLGLKCALQARRLDPEGFAAHPLVVRLRLLEQLGDPCPAGRVAAGGARGVLLGLRPVLPPVDAGVVQALEKLQAQWTRQARGWMWVEVIEASGGQETSEPPQAPADVQIESNDGALRLESDAAENPLAAGGELLGALHRLTKTEIDVSRPGTVRVFVGMFPPMLLPEASWWSAFSLGTNADAGK